jgi:hypothetical protein
VIVAVTLHVSFPIDNIDMLAEHDDGVELPPPGAPPPPPSPTAGGLPNKVLLMLLKNDIIELNIEEKKLLIS